MARTALWALALTALAACGGVPEEDVEADEGEVVANPRVDPTGAKLAACASPLMRAVFDATEDVIAQGSVPGRVYATSRNVADDEALVMGPEIFPAMAKLIEGARHEVDVQFYVWEGDSQPAQEILDGIKRLEQRRKREAAEGEPPVVVRFLLDVSTIGFGSNVKMMSALGEGVEALALDPRHVTVESALFRHKAMGALHTKSLVVDGRSAILTGANAQEHHDYAEPWYDAGFRFDGEVARSLLADFDYHWAHPSARRWVCGSRHGSAEECQRPTEALTRTLGEDAGDLAGDACTPMFVATRVGDWLPGSNRTDNPQDRAFLAAFAGAKRVIRMHTPNLNDDAAKRALLDAMTANPALQVRVVLSKGFNDLTEDMPGQGGNNAKNVAELYGSLKARGVTDACRRLQIRWYSKDGQAPVEGNGPHAAHAKYTSFDDALAIVGTANMDTQSWNNSHEVNVVVDRAATVRRWDAKVFDASFERGIVADECLGEQATMPPASSRLVEGQLDDLARIAAPPALVRARAD